MLIENKGKKLTTPTYFPAISSAEYGRNFDELIKTVIISGYPRLLISAYDYAGMSPKVRKRLSGEISNYIRSGGLLLVDSGGFEKYWKEDKKWEFRDFERTITKMNFDFYLSFDVLYRGGTQFAYSKTANRTFERSLKLRPKEVCIPIVHGKDPSTLISSVWTLVSKYPHSCKIISVPERECGTSMMQRARTITSIRKILNDSELGATIIHVLGCGNPISMAAYAYCGADSFDSVDWSTILIQPHELQLYDISQVELLKCTCKMCERFAKKSSQPLFHNLLFYQDFILQLQKMIKENTLKDFLLEYLGQTNLTDLG